MQLSVTLVVAVNYYVIHHSFINHIYKIMLHSSTYWRCSFCVLLTEFEINIIGEKDLFYKESLKPAWLSWPSTKMTALHKLKRKDIKVCSPKWTWWAPPFIFKAQKYEHAKASKIEGGDSPTLWLNIIKQSQEESRNEEGAACRQGEDMLLTGSPTQSSADTVSPT